MTKIFRGALLEQELSIAPTPGVRNTNHETSCWASISQRRQEMSLHIQIIQVGSVRNSVTQDIALDIALEKNVLYSVPENTFFPIRRDT